MPLPGRIRVKLSSESAGYISLTPVVVQEFSLQQLLEHVVSATGKNTDRIQEVLRRGTLVSGASRLRWEPLGANEGEIAAALSGIPDAEPARPFDRARCLRAVLHGGLLRLEISRDLAERRRLLRRRSFWDALLEEAASPEYVDYQYRERTDQYAVRLSTASVARIHAAARLLKFRPLAQQVAAARFDSVRFFTSR